MTGGRKRRWDAPREQLNGCAGGTEGCHGSDAAFAGLASTDGRRVSGIATNVGAWVRCRVAAVTWWYRGSCAERLVGEGGAAGAGESVVDVVEICSKQAGLQAVSASEVLRQLS